MSVVTKQQPTKVMKPGGVCHNKLDYTTAQMALGRIPRPGGDPFAGLWDNYESAVGDPGILTARRLNTEPER